MSLFAELRRRNVFRVAIAYVVVTWLLVQVADVMIDNIGAPDWLFSGILLVLGIGFPIALVFAWAFEMTPEGIKREHEVDRTASITSQTGRRLDRLIIGVLVVALGYFVFDKFSGDEVAPQPALTDDAATVAQATAPAEPSIAVLPFVNMSNDPEQEYFSDGISEELLNLLVRVDGLKVASRTSSFAYKGSQANIPQIASELKVDHVLEGSVRKAGERVRITAQLIDTTNDRHLWSDAFDRELDDIFAIQDEIANAIVSALQETLGVGLEAVSVKADTDNLDAYDLYLKAREMFIARQNLPQAIALLERVTEMDPAFARGWEALAATQSVADSWLATDGIDHQPLAEAAARRALELDPGLSMPWAVIGMLPINNSDDYLRATESLDKAIANDPKNATAWLWRGIILRDLGYTADSVSDLRRCLDIDPGYLNCRQHLAVTLLQLGQSEEALEHFELTITENFHSISGAFVHWYASRGERVNALLLASASLARIAPYAPIDAWVDAIMYPERDPSRGAERFRRWAEDAGAGCDRVGFAILSLGMYDCLTMENRASFMWMPEAAEYRNTEHFKPMVRQYLLGYWQQHGFPPQCRPLEGEDFECD